MVLFTNKFFTLHRLFKTTIVSFVDWKTVPNPIQAAELYRQSVLKVHASEKPLYLHVDLTSSISDQEASLIAFYKACNVNWACPLKTRLEGVFYSERIDYMKYIRTVITILFFSPRGSCYWRGCKPFLIFNDYTETEMWFSPKPWYTHTSSMSKSTVLKFGLL